MPKKPRSRAAAGAPLTKERVLRTAVALADKSGVEALTMRKLADKLGIEAMSLYHHVANKDAILDAMVDAVFAEIALPDRGGSWKAAMRDRAASARAALLRHPWALGMLESRASPGPATLRHHDAVLGCLRTAGFPVALAAHAFSVLDSYIYGFVLQELNLPFDTSGDLEEVVAGILQDGAAEAFPFIAELAIEHVLKPGYDYAGEFPIGLELILDGLERMLEAGR